MKRSFEQTKSILLCGISYSFSKFAIFLANSVKVLNNNNSISMGLGLSKQDVPFSQDGWCPGKTGHPVLSPRPVFLWWPQPDYIPLLPIGTSLHRFNKSPIA